MLRDSAITAATAVADTGTITIVARHLIDLQNSWITTSAAAGEGSAGNITIDPDFRDPRRQRILARGGARPRRRHHDRRRQPDPLAGQSDQRRAPGDEGIDGTVVTSEPAVDLASALVVLDAGLLNADALLRERCAARHDVGASSFTGAGRGGLPPSPDQPARQRLSATGRGGGASGRRR